MAQLLIRGLPDEVKEKLRARALAHGRSLEAEARDVLEQAALAGQPSELASSEEKGFGDLMHDCFGKRGLTPREQRRLKRAIEELRDASMMRVPDFDAW